MKNNTSKFFLAVLLIGAGVFAWFKFRKKTPVKKNTAQVYVGDADILHSPTDEILDLGGIKIDPVKMAPLSSNDTKYLTDVLQYYKPRLDPVGFTDYTPPVVQWDEQPLGELIKISK